MDFYKFWQILENKNEWIHGVRKFPEPPDTPPDYPENNWDDDDLVWGDWEEDGTTVKLMNGRFVDFKNNPLPFLDEYVGQVQNWDQSRGISLDWSRKYGTLPGFENPKTGQYRDDEEVKVELEKLSLSDYKNPNNKIELPDNLIAKVKNHFFKGYD
jgi:hypothetical protein